MPRNQTSASSPRTCLLVLGMHRSGTSALTGTLGLLGGVLPASRMEGREDNLKGFFESGRLQQFNDRILERLGSSWDDWKPLDFEILSGPEREALRQEALALIAEDFEGTGPMLFKDPRVPRLLPLWLDWLEGGGYRVNAVQILRAPAQVAASLNQRDAMTPQAALLSWLRHVLDAEQLTRKLPRVFVTYDELMEDWRGMAQRIAGGLQITWPKPLEDAKPEIDRFLEPGLRHFREGSTPEMPKVVGADWAEQVEGILTGWRRGGAQTTGRKQLDGIRRAFDAALPLIAPLMEMEASRRKSLEEAQAKVAAYHKRVADAEAGWQRSSDQLAEAQAALERLSAERGKIDHFAPEAQTKASEVSALEEASSRETAPRRAKTETAELAPSQLKADHEEMRLKNTHLEGILEREQMLRASERAMAASQIADLESRLTLLHQRQAAELTAQAHLRDTEQVSFKAQLARYRAENERMKESLIEQEHRNRQQQKSLDMLSEVEAKLHRLQQTHDETLSELRQRRHEAEQAHYTILEQKQAAQDARNAVSLLELRLTSVTTDLEAAEADRRRLRAEMLELEARIARDQIAQRAQKARQAAEAEQSTARITTLTREAAERSAQVELLERELQEGRHHLAEVETRLGKVQGLFEDLQHEKGQLAEALAQVSAEHELQRAEVEALRGSTSWRITAPLRKAVMLFRR